MEPLVCDQHHLSTVGHPSLRRSVYCDLLSWRAPGTFGRVERRESNPPGWVYREALVAVVGPEGTTLKLGTVSEGPVVLESTGT